jgi:hypothetical protein
MVPMIKFLCNPPHPRAAIAWLLGSLAGILLLPQIASAQVPTVNVQNTCRIAAVAMMNLLAGTTIEKGMKDCLENENTALAQIVKDWESYSAADRSQCLQTGVYLPSYVEWLTCIEMERDARRMRLERNEPVAGPQRVVDLPIVSSKPLWGNSPAISTLADGRVETSGRPQPVRRSGAPTRTAPAPRIQPLLPVNW